MGRSKVRTSEQIKADEAHRFFDDKVAGVRASTDGAPPPSYSTAPLNARFRNFCQLTVISVRSKCNVTVITRKGPSIYDVHTKSDFLTPPSHCPEASTLALLPPRHVDVHNFFSPANFSQPSLDRSHQTWHTNVFLCGVFERGQFLKS